LKDVEKERKKYFIICTGCQGEPHSVLNRMATGQFHFNFKQEDQVIFAASVIPTAINKANRAELELKLKQKSVRLFTDVHVSGHAAREDIRDLINMIRPKNFIPTHGDPEKIVSAIELAKELGYTFNKNVFILQDGQKITL
jgi:ribonuclease J